MKKVITLCVLCMLVQLEMKSQQNQLDTNQAWCASCNVQNLNADVFIVLPNKQWGNNITSQFQRVTDKSPYMSKNQIVDFLGTKGFEFLRFDGSAFFLMKEGKQISLVEIIKDMTGNFLWVTQSIERIIKNDENFVNVIIPRNYKNKK